MGYSARRLAPFPTKAFACALLCALSCVATLFAPGTARAAVFLETPPTLSGDTAPLKFRFATQNSGGVNPTVAFRPAGSSTWVRCSSLREWTQSGLEDGSHEFSIADDAPAVVDGVANPDCAGAEPATAVSSFKFGLDRIAPTIQSAMVTETSGGSLQFEVAAYDVGGLGELKWDFGDGSSLTTDALVATHAYDGLFPKFAVVYLSDLANNFTVAPIALPAKELIVLGAAETTDDGNKATCSSAKKSLSRKRVLLQRLLEQYRKRRSSKLRKRINRARRDLRRVKLTVYDACG